MNRHVTDFECTTDEPVAVWLWYDYNVDTGEYNHGYNIESFIEFVEQHPRHDFYFHNLSYDGSFIFSYLLDVKKYKHNVTDYPKFQPTLQGKMDDFTYIFDFDKWVNFFDTMAILTGSLAMFAKSVGLEKGDTSKDAMYTNSDIPMLSKDDWKRAKAYCKQDVKILAEVCKKYHLFELMQIRRTKAGLAYAGLTEWKLSSELYQIRPNYRPPRPDENTHPEAELCNVTCIEYCSKSEYEKENRKTKVIPKSEYEEWSPQKKSANVIIDERIEEVDLDKVRYYERKFDVETLYFQDEYTFYQNPTTPYRLKYSVKKYGEELYNSTKHVNMDTISVLNKSIKEAYKGGINYVNPDYQDIWIDDPVYVYDVNSMYPWIYSSKPMPDIRTLKPVDALSKDDLGFVRIQYLHARCKTGRMPLLKLKTGIQHINSTHYLPDFNVTNSFVLTNIEYQYLLEHYDIISIGKVLYLEAERNTALEEAFKTFCDHWYEEKKVGRSEGDTTREWFAKLMLNSLYGKFGQFESQYQNFKYLLVDDTLAKDDVLNYIDSMWDADLAVASYITAYGRVHLAETINHVGMDKFVYCDTDSVHVIGEADLNVGNELGQWKLEGISSRSKFIQPKTYGEHLETGWHTTCAGFTDQIPEEDFRSGMKIKVKRGFLVKGGYQIQDRYIELGGNLAQDFVNGYTKEEMDKRSRT
ncbi:DNA polymerase [Streptococcus suis]